MELKVKFLLKNPPSSRKEAAALNRRFSLLHDFRHPRWDHERFQRLNQELEASCGGLGEYVRGMAAISHECTAFAPIKPEMWLAKEVGGRTDDVTKAWMSMFYDGKVLFNLRYPPYVVRSIFFTRRRINLSMSLHRAWRAMNDTVRVTWDCARMATHDWACPVLYESVTSPDERDDLIRGLCSFLGIPFDPVMLTPTLFGENTIVGTSSRNTTRVFRQEGSWRSGLPPALALWVAFSYAILNARHSARSGMRHLRRYADLAAEMRRLVAEKAELNPG